MQLQKLDEDQRQTLADLQFYAQEQRALTEKLMEQERMLQLVQRDISERENLIQFVFKERLESMASATNINQDQSEEMFLGDHQHRQRRKRPQYNGGDNDDGFNIRETEEEQEGDYYYGSSDDQNN